MKIIVGLGNPGRRYEKTRHNVGFHVLDELARRDGATFRRSWNAKARTCKVQVGRETLFLVKPLTFMNRSGQAVEPFLRKKGLSVEDLIVIVDDTELDVGRLRLRQKGGAGGHNGLKSLLASLGSEDFARVRVGVGQARPGQDLAAYVLSDFTAADRKAMKEIVPRAADAVVAIVEDGPDRAMNTFN